MPTLWITEFAAGGTDYGGRPMQTVAQLPVAEQVVTISAVSAQSAALNAATVIVRLHTDTACAILFAANPTATAAKMRLAANATEYFTVPAASGYKIAGITGV